MSAVAEQLRGAREELPRLHQMFQHRPEGDGVEALLLEVVLQETFTNDSDATAGSVF